MECNFSEVEKKWQKRWHDWQTFKAENNSSKPKFYVLDMFPYPSGSGLHVGHPLGYIASDIYARFKRHQGYNVLHPMGYDSYGLPAEQYAIQTGQHPAITTEQNIKRYREQLDQIGFSFDWSRQVKTSEPEFYRWTQWIFVKLFHSWYNNQSNRAEPIQTLIREFEAHGNSNVDAACDEVAPFSASHWNSWNDHQKREILLSYRIAYRAETIVNWCPALGTVLANDEVVNGVSERGGHPVEQKKMLQWSLRIRAYAQRLLDGLDTVEWNDSLKDIQRNWIGRSEGAEIEFKVVDTDKKILVFTTRPDTIFGATFMVLAPEHELVSRITTTEQSAEIDKYVEWCKSRSERERMAEVKDVTGAFTGAYAENPITGTKIPIWISDYVLAGYGTGAIMAVPAGDERDWDFAQRFDLPIIPIIDGQDVSKGADERKDGTMINSGFLDGMPVKKAISTVIEKVVEMGIGQHKINYKLRDAVFSRQRYWGEPFPIYYRDGIPYTIDEDKLDEIRLPEIDNFKPTETGEPPLGRATHWNWDREAGKIVENGKGYPMELSTMPGWAGSNWYYLRYMMEGNKEERAKAFVSKEAVDYWGQVDLYIGGAEHATGHLLYFRFVTKFLYDLGYIPFDEPAKKLINQGMIAGEPRAVLNRFDHFHGIRTKATNLFISDDVCTEIRKGKISPNELHQMVINQLGNDVANEIGIDQHNGLFISPYQEGLIFDGQPHPERTLIRVDNYVIDGVVDVDSLKSDIRNFNSSYFLKNASNEFMCGWMSEKMSKSKGNVINPDEIVRDHSADALRLHEMFLGPIEMHKPWNTKGIDGVTKFMRKLWRLFHDAEGNTNISDDAPTKEELKALHKCIQKVTEDMERFSFNTSVSAFMIAVNELGELKCNKREILEPLTILVSCHAPHIAEELWETLGHRGSISAIEWPKFDESYLKSDSVNYPISFNGKTRFHLELSASLGKEDVEKEVLENEVTHKWLEGASPKKVIVVPGRIVNIVH